MRDAKRKGSIRHTCLLVFFHDDVEKKKFLNFYLFIYFIIIIFEYLLGGGVRKHGKENHEGSQKEELTEKCGRVV